MNVTADLSATAELPVTADLTAASWRTSTHSGSQGGDCVEVADGIPGLMPVRDSKDPEGPALVFAAGAWSAFITALKAGEFPALAPPAADERGTDWPRGGGHRSEAPLA